MQTKDCDFYHFHLTVAVYAMGINVFYYSHCELVLS